MIWTEAAIIAAISRQVLNRRCVLLVDNCQWTGHECDVLGVTTDPRIIDVEVKISRADLKADAGKDKWWHHLSASWQGGKMVRPDPVHRDWPRRVWKHYYAMPEEIWKPELIAALGSAASGVILLREGTRASGYNRDGVAVSSVKRRAKPNPDAYRLSQEEVMDVARLANLRMWDAYDRVARLKDDYERMLMRDTNRAAA